MARPHPPALPHGELEEVLPDIYVVTGTIAMAMSPPMRFSRNMTVVREGERLVLINSVRLDEAGLSALDRLGKVTDVIRLAGFHGMDDPFYKERYGAKVWAVRGQRYVAGLDANVAETYFQADVDMDATTALPLSDASLYVFSCSPPEALLLLRREGGIVVSGDCLQNWARPDRHFNLAGKLIMRLMGFFKPYNIGPAWLRVTKPAKAELRGILDLDFRHVIPAHGVPVIGEARERYRPRIERIG